MLCMKEQMLIKVKAYHIYVLKLSIPQDMVTKCFGKTKEKKAWGFKYGSSLLP